MSSKYQAVPEETDRLPRGIKYIIGNEAAERFSFYGMRTILVVFMTKYLHVMTTGEAGPQMSGAAANEIYHNFVAATYFFPIVGSLLSDIFVGKYRTILWLSIVYCVGHLSLALMGTPGRNLAVIMFAWAVSCIQTQWARPALTKALTWACWISISRRSRERWAELLPNTACLEN